MRESLIVNLYSYYISGDSLGNHKNQAFTTYDKNHDGKPKDDNCAVKFKGAWWYPFYYSPDHYGGCHQSNLNGLYLAGSTSSFAKGVVWYHWRGHNYSLKHVEMKIKRLL